MRSPARVIVLGAVTTLCFALTVPAIGAPSQPLAPIPVLDLLQGGEGTETQATARELAVVRLSLSSSSDWSVVQLLGVYVADFRVRSVSEGVLISQSETGWRMEVPAGGGVAEIDAVVAVSTADAVLRVEKGRNGAASATLLAGGASPVTVSTAPQEGPATATTEVPRDVLASAISRPPRADERRLALAFYYPWFSRYDELRFAEKPSQPRSAKDASGVLSMTQQARSNGVDGFIVSWSTAEQDGLGYDLAVQAAEETDGLVAPYLEVAALADRSPTTADLARRVRASLVEVLARSDSPAVLRSGGVPVIFAFETKRLPAEEWRGLLESLAGDGQPVRLVGDSDGAWYANQWGVHRYSVNEDPSTLTAAWSGMATSQRADDLLDGTSRLVTATVSPGYDDRRRRGLNGRQIPRDDGRRYAATWDATRAADPDWMLITSWNEWFEGTTIEPGTRSGAQALAQTATFIEEWKAR